MTLPHNGAHINLFDRQAIVHENFLEVRGGNKLAFTICGFSIQPASLQALYRSLDVMFDKGDFPEVADRQQLQTLVSYIYKHGETLRKPSFSIEDEVWINEYKMVVKKSKINGLYCLHHPQVDNWEPFKSLGDANTLYDQIIGHSSNTTGCFPFCRTLPELTTFVDELRRRLKLPVFRALTSAGTAASVAVVTRTPRVGSPHDVDIIML